MAGRKKENFERERVEFKAEASFIRRLDQEAQAGGHGNISALIRFVLTEYLDRKDQERRGRKG